MNNNKFENNENLNETEKNLFLNKNNDEPEFWGDHAPDLDDEDEAILDKAWAEIRKQAEREGRLNSGS